MNSGRKAKGSGGDAVCHSKATHDGSDLRQRGQENKADEPAIAPTDTQHITSSHSLAIQFGGIKDGNKRWGGNNSSSTGFFCLDAFGKATAVHRIGWRAGIHGRHRIPQENTEGIFSVRRGNMAMMFFLFFSGNHELGERQVHVRVSNIPIRAIRARHGVFRAHNEHA